MKIKTTEQFYQQWVAVDDDTYDGPGSPIGQGSTEIAAIRDLLDVIEQQEESSSTTPYYQLCFPGCFPFDS